MQTKYLTLCLSLMLIAGLRLSAQETTAPVMPVDPETKLITYKEVVTIQGTPAELFNRAVEWINKQYKNPVDATKVRDQASGVIEIIHRFDITRQEKEIQRPVGIIDYSLKIEMKDGRYRYTLTNLNRRDVSRQPIEKWLDKSDKAYSPDMEIYLKQIDDAARKLIDSLKQGMQPPIQKKPDTW
jgi:hypothetical protein